MQWIQAQDKSSGTTLWNPFYTGFSSYSRTNVVGIHCHANSQREGLGSTLAFSYDWLRQLIQLPTDSGFANENLKYRKKLPISIMVNFWANSRLMTIPPVLKLLWPNRRLPIHDVRIMTIHHFNLVCNCDKQQGPPYLTLHAVFSRSQHGWYTICHRKLQNMKLLRHFPKECSTRTYIWITIHSIK